jgi:hypothetical protein
MSASTVLTTMKLSNHKDGVISVAHIDQPYGDFSSPVVSIGVTLEPEISSDPQWQVHIPYHDIDAVIAALNKAKEFWNEHDTGNHPHDELASDTGGGGA